MQRELIEQVIRHFGTQEKAADALDCSQPLISAWLNGSKSVSLEMAMRIQSRTKRAFKASSFNKRAAEFEEA